MLSFLALRAGYDELFVFCGNDELVGRARGQIRQVIRPLDLPFRKPSFF
jgi:hypothetical protein